MEAQWCGKTKPVSGVYAYLIESRLDDLVDYAVRKAMKELKEEHRHKHT
jgi:hypothetical protein